MRSHTPANRSETWRRREVGVEQYLHIVIVSQSEIFPRWLNLKLESMSESDPQIPNQKPSPSPKIPSNYRNPRETVNPDAATLRDQWRFAIRQYSRWYSQAWGTAILAGVSFFALGWIIKGSNPLPSLQSSPPAADADKDKPEPQSH